LSYDTGIHLRAHLALIMQQVTTSLYSDASKSTDYFEAFTAVYKVGLEPSPVRISGDRKGNIVSSSDVSYLTISTPAFELLKNSVMKICNPTRPPLSRSSLSTGQKAPEQHVMAYLNWQTDHKRLPRPVKLTKAEDVISILVCLALTSPFIAQETRALILNVAESSNEEDAVKKTDSQSFPYYFHIQTNAYSVEIEHGMESHDGLQDKTATLPASNSPFPITYTPLNTPMPTIRGVFKT
jgi:hypothetical protein